MDKYIYTILRENVTTFEEKHELDGLTESDSSEVQNQVVTNILKGIGGRRVDFAEIGQSKGRLEKFIGYENMSKAIDFISTLTSNQKCDELVTVKQAMTNILLLGDLFNKGFKVENSMIKLTYNTLVYACLDLTSHLISCVEMDGDQLSLEIRGKRSHDKCMLALKRFNTECTTNRMQKSLKDILNSGRNNLVGGGAAVMGLVLAIAVSIIPIIRECIYLFYSMRIRVSDYLNQQAKFLEIEAMTVEQSSLSADRKQKVIMSQRNRISELRKLSDKLSVEYAIADKKSTEEISKENKGWTLNAVRSEANSSSQGSGFQLI